MLMRPYGLRLRIIVMVLLVSVPVMAGGVVFLTRQATAFLRHEAQQRLAQVATQLGQRVMTFDDGMLEDLENLAGQPDVVSMDPALQRPVLMHMVATHPGLQYVHTTNRDGINVARNDDRAPLNYSDRPWFQQALAGRHGVRQTLVSRTSGMPAIVFSTPIANQGGEILGVVCFGIDLNALTKLVGSTRYGRTGYSLVVDDKGRALAYPDHQRAEELEDLMSVPPVGKVVSTRAALTTQFKDDAGRTWLAHAMPLANGWSVVSFQEEKEVLAEVDSILTLCGWVILATAVLIAAGTWFVTLRATRPLAEMTEVAQEIAQGHWNRRLKEGRADELGVLARAFNRMLEALRAAFASVEAKVQARTQELAAANERFLEEIEERQRAEEALQETQRQLALILQSASEGICAMGEEGEILTANPAAERLLGRPAHELIGTPFHALVHGVLPQACPCDTPGCPLAEALVQRKAVHGVIGQFRRADGAVFPIEYSVAPMGEGPEQKGAVITFKDVTRRRQTEETLRKTKDFLDNILDNIGEPLLVKDSQHRYVLVNEAFCRMVGRPRPELLGKDDWACFPPEQARQFWVADDDVLATGQPSSIEEQISESNGEVKWYLTRKTRYVDPDGSAYVVVLTRNITERRQAEQVLQTRMAAIDAAADMVVITDPNAVIEYVNPAFERLMGYTAEEAIGKTPALIKSGKQDGVFYEQLWETVRAGRPWTGQLINRAKDGTLLPVEMTLTPVLDARGRVQRFVAITRDTRERLKTEEIERERQHLRQAVAALEQVLGVVSHELRTPIASLRVLVEMIRHVEIRQSAAAAGFIETMHGQVLQLASMVADLLETARLNSGHARWHWETITMPEVLEAAVGTIRPLVAPGVTLETPSCPTGLAMRGDGHAIRRLLVNLLGNACKHTQTGRLWAAVADRVEQGVRWIDLTVGDTGCGISPTLAGRLGQAFALSAGVIGENHITGAGLGLAICRGITAAFGGQITIRSAPGHGTVVEVSLRADLTEPVQEAETAAPLRYVLEAPAAPAGEQMENVNS